MQVRCAAGGGRLDGCDALGVGVRRVMAVFLWGGAALGCLSVYGDTALS